MKTLKTAGFSLIELMIVVAIIGILAAVAVPAYQTYINKSKFAEMFVAADAAKNVVSEYVNLNGGFWTAIGNGVGCSNLTVPFPTTNNVSSVSVDSLCNIRVNGGVNLPVRIELYPRDNGSGVLQWTCNTYPYGTTFAPSSCPSPADG